MNTQSNSTGSYISRADIYDQPIRMLFEKVDILTLPGLIVERSVNGWTVIDIPVDRLIRVAYCLKNLGYYSTARDVISYGERVWEAVYSPDEVTAKMARVTRVLNLR